MKAIIMMHGLPGTGKSFAAEQIAKNIPNTVILKSVQFRAKGVSSPVDFDETNARTREEKDKSYRKLCEAAKEALKEHKIPILDATFHKKYRREWAYNVAREIHADLAIISLSCTEEIIRQRLLNRKEKIDQDSFLKSVDAYRIMKEQSDLLVESDYPVKAINSKDININEVVEWIRNILS